MKEFFLHAGEQCAMNAVAETGLSVRQLEAMAQRFEQRFNTIEPRLTVPTSADLIDQQVLAARIANYENLMRTGQIGNVRVGSHNRGLAYEALMGQVPGIQVTTLKARDLHTTSYFSGRKKPEGWRTTYSDGEAPGRVDAARSSQPAPPRPDGAVSGAEAYRVYRHPYSTSFG